MEKEFGSTLEVKRLKERTQSLSNIDIRISPCDPDHRPSDASAASPQSDRRETNVEKPAEKTRLEAAVSFPLEKSKVTQYSSSQTLSDSPSSNRKSISSTILSSAHEDQDWWTSVTRLSSQHVSISPCMPHWGDQPSSETSVEKSKGDETKQEVEERKSGPSDGQHEGHSGNGGAEEPSEDDRMFPTLRSKSLNVNPRKKRSSKKESEKVPRSACSVKDLVSTFSKFTEGDESRSRSRDSDC